MKIVNLFKKELKTKWSSRLLMGILMCLVCSLFASNIILKQQYDLVKDKPKDRLKGYQKIVNQFFTHIKTEGGQILGQIQFETSNEAGVFIKERDKDLTKWRDNIFVKNDTLFLNFNQEATNKMNEYGSGDVFVYIVAPNIQSITADNSHITINDWQQKSMSVNLSNKSSFEVGNIIGSIDLCKISMSNFSTFRINNSKHNAKNIDIQTFEATVSDSCDLSLGNATIQNLKLNATEGNKIELSSETLNALMKQ